MHPARACATCRAELLEDGDALRCPAGHDVSRWLVVDVETAELLAIGWRDGVVLGRTLAAAFGPGA